MKAKTGRSGRARNENNPLKRGPIVTIMTKSDPLERSPIAIAITGN